MALTGYILMGIGSFITAINFYLSFLRFPVHLACGGSRETYQHISGFPLVGSLLLWISILLLPSATLAWCAAAVSTLDTGGIHWFVYALWRQGELKHFFFGNRNSGA